MPAVRLPPQRSHTRRRPGGGFRTAVGLLLLGVAAPACAQPVLRCEVVQGGETRTVVVAPAADPYGFAAADIRGHFRFKPVFVADAAGIEYVKLYTYYRKDGQPVLMHVAKYLRPALPSAGEVVALTGTAQLFSPSLGREIEYSCALVGAAP